MKLFRFPGTMVLILGLLLCPIALSEKYPQITIFVTIGVQEDSPLQIIGFKRAHSPHVVIHNVSSKQIIKVDVYALRGSIHVEDNSDAPVGGVGPGNGGDIGYGGVFSREERMPPIPPNGFGEITLRNFRSENLGVKLPPPVNVRSNCMHVAAVVSRVEFDDGTSWRMDWNKSNETWRKSISTESLNSCQYSPGSEQALNQVIANTFQKFGNDIDVDDATVQQYSLKCSVVTIDKKLAISCPWI